MAGLNPDPIRMIIQGAAETGKSYVIDEFKKLLGEKLEVGAFTAKAAENIGGKTLHSMFGLRVNASCAEYLGPTAFQKLADRNKGVEYYILDEFSMIGCDTLATISLRLQQLGNTHNVFGNASVILVGDLH